MDPAKYDIKIIRGVTFKKRFTVTSGGSPVDFSACDASALLVPGGDESSEIPFVATCDGSGHIDVLMVKETTAGLDYDEADWNVEIEEPDGTNTRWFEGLVRIRD